MSPQMVLCTPLLESLGPLAGEGSSSALPGVLCLLHVMVNDAGNGHWRTTWGFCGNAKGTIAINLILLKILINGTEQFIFVCFPRQGSSV